MKYLEMGYSIPNNSTSKMSVLFGPPGPRDPLPYAKLEGTYNSHLEPTGINCKASVQPLMTPVTGKVAGFPRLYELSNSSPFIRVPR